MFLEIFVRKIKLKENRIKSQIWVPVFLDINFPSCWILNFFLLIFISVIYFSFSLLTIRNSYIIFNMFSAPSVISLARTGNLRVNLNCTKKKWFAANFHFAELILRAQRKDNTSKIADFRILTKTIVINACSNWLEAEETF